MDVKYDISHKERDGEVEFTGTDKTTGKWFTYIFGAPNDKCYPFLGNTSGDTPELRAAVRRYRLKHFKQTPKEEEESPRFLTYLYVVELEIISDNSDTGSEDTNLHLLGVFFELEKAEALLKHQDSNPGYYCSYTPGDGTVFAMTVTERRPGVFNNSDPMTIYVYEWNEYRCQWTRKTKTIKPGTKV